MSQKRHTPGQVINTLQQRQVLRQKRRIGLVSLLGEGEATPGSPWCRLNLHRPEKPFGVLASGFLMAHQR